MISKIWIKTVIFGIFFIGFPCLNADTQQTAKTPEYLVKAMFLYNFANFVHWPDDAFENPEAPVIICILGENPFGGALESIKNKYVGEKQIIIRMCERVHEIKKCHVLYISASESLLLPEILSEIRDLSCLSVSDMSGFAGGGGMIGFFMLNNRIRFEINPDAAKRSRLQISSRLLKLARIVGEHGKESLYKP